MSRKESRDKVFKLIYEKSIIGELNELSYSNITQDTSSEDLEYIESTCLGVVKTWNFLEKTIERYSIEYRVDRIFRIDYSLMLIAIYEILFVDSIPYKVSINEAVALSKRYSTERSHKFINGLLSSVLKDKDLLLKEYNEINQI